MCLEVSMHQLNNKNFELLEFCDIIGTNLVRFIASEARWRIHMITLTHRQDMALTRIPGDRTQPILSFNTKSVDADKWVFRYKTHAKAGEIIHVEQERAPIK